MRKSAFFQIDPKLSSMLGGLDGGRWKAFSFSSIPELLEFVRKNETALICWSGDGPESQRREILANIRGTPGVQQSANIIVSRTKDAEALFLKGGADEFIILPCDEKIFKLRVENALRRKDAYREAREQMWMSFGYRNAALGESLYMYDIDLKTGRATVLRTSDEAIANYYPLECYTSGPRSEFYFHPEDWHLIVETFSPDGLAAMLKSGQTEKRIEYRIRNRKDEWAWVETKVHLVRDMYGEVHGFSYVKLIDEEMREKQLFEHILREEIDLILGIAPAKGWCRCIYRRDGGQMASGSYDDTYFKLLTDSLTGPETQDLLKKLRLPALAEALENGQALDYMCSLSLPDGQSERKRMRIFYADERRQQIIIVRRDITGIYREAQKQKGQLKAALDEAEKANAAKNVFLSNVSHDMRTPLNGVIGYTDLALESSDINLVHSYLGHISESARILLRLVNDTLDLSKIENGLITLNPEPANLAGLVQGVAASVMPSAEAKRIELVCGGDQHSEIYVKADIARMQELLINLLSNAIKFTPQGGKVELVLNCAPLGEDRIRSTIVIRDNGIGMSSEFIPRMFDPFAQERNPHCTDTSGSGLGLTIVKRIVEIMGGTIEVKSEQEKGSEFILHLDFARDLASPSREQSGPRISLSLKGKKVLLCEDHPMNSEIAKGLLEKEGMTVVCADNGIKGVSAMSASAPGEFDLVLMDIRMPLMDGLEAARAIRALPRPDAATVPIIAMTANAFDEDVQKSREAGMNAHLSKPIDPLVLYRTISELLS